MDLEERLHEITRWESDLTGTDDDPRDIHPHRPEISVSADFDEEIGGSHVSLCLKALWGQPMRWVDLLPNEARKLADALNEMARSIEAEWENHQEAAYDRQQERLMENGPGPSLRDQQIAAMKFK